MSERKYNFLTNSFFNGSTKNQINAIYKDQNIKPEKVIEYRLALRNGDCKIDLNEITKHQLNKIIELGVYGTVLEIEEESNLT